MTPREELVGQIAECVREIAHAVDATTTHEWLHLDLTMAQLKALFALTSAAPITIGALGQKLGIRLPAASHVADQLVQLELAERYEDTEDRRRTLIRPTARGSALIEQLRQGRYDRFHSWLSALGDEDLAALHQGLRAFATAVGATRC